MKSAFLRACVASLALVAGGLAICVPASAAENEVVTYRLVEWKKLHFSDSQKAKQQLETIKNLGCEMRKDTHEGHVDVSYRCPQWKTMKLEAHADAHRWQGWLKAAGFETRHSH